MNAAPLVTRYAPSPTGYLHLGHVAHLIYVWGLAELLDARVLLRIEDHDRQRCRPEYETAIFQDLNWLGFEPANALLGEYRQSDSDSEYAEALGRLRSNQNVYRCVCTRKDLAAHSVISVDGERVYSGRCRTASHGDDVPHGVRLELDDGAERFEDGFLGAQEQVPSAQCGDLLLRDRFGQWTYQFAATVDDMRHGVNLVVRGEDLLASTGRQIRLARLLGRGTPARFIHHPLITDPGGIKLSKKQQSPAIRDLRAAGVTAAAVLGEAAGAVGLLESARPVERGELCELIEARTGLATK